MSTESDKQRIEKLKDIALSLEEMVVVIDKIGSGFNDTERVALALLLFFKRRDGLGKLAKARNYLYQELEQFLPHDEFEDLIEKDIDLWEIPYDKTRAELLEMINKDNL